MKPLRFSPTKKGEPRKEPTNHALKPLPKLIKPIERKQTTIAKPILAKTQPKPQLAKSPIRKPKKNSLISGSASPGKRGRKPREITCTKEQIEHARDTEGRAWSQVAKMLGLGSGPTAKRAYAELTGRDPEATETTTRAKKGSGVVDTVSALQIYWDDDDDEIEIRTAISHRTIVVERSIGKDYLWYEEIQVAEVRGFIYNQLDIKTGEREPCDMAVEFTQRDTGGYRCVKVKWIREVH